AAPAGVFRSPSAGPQRAGLRPSVRTAAHIALSPPNTGRPGQKATGIPTTDLPGRPSPTHLEQTLDSSRARREKHRSSSPHQQPPLSARRALLRSSPLPARPVAPPPARRVVEELVVPDAGLVLLWPFLPRYLQKLGWVDERPGFVDEVRRMWAIFQLGLLSDGRPPREHWLGLPKLLCGVEPDSFWFLPGEPAEAERIAAAEEGERLLAAVIAHVRALRDPPVAAFQRDFLRREGILSRRSPRWLLRVQPAPQDLLLPQFPWTWAWIRLPWMDAALEVEW
ncbi:MAG TPA: contractile injection system tape measure protein, partial [Myxococcota bacterium]|nr:contractile injection system tape measure protein [Myxococcota bacterium]